MNSAPPASLARLSMRLPSRLLHQLGKVVEERGLRSRSHWIADLIRDELAEHGTAVRPDDMLAGTVTIVYRGSVARVRRQLSDVLSGFLKEAISSQHVFLDEEQSLEVLIVQGPAKRLRALSNAIRQVRGVQQLRLTTTMALLPPLHEQPRGAPGRERKPGIMPLAHRGATPLTLGDDKGP